jgi:hypothetical protein
MPNRADFLRDRNIALQGINYDGQFVVSRGEMYAALMDIHRAEELFFDTRNIVPFHDAFGRLELQLNIGRSLGVLSGFDDGFFRPDLPLMRRDLFVILAGQIDAFGFEVEGLMPARPDAIGMPSNTDYWYRHLNNLMDVRFIPFRITRFEATDYEPSRYVYDLAPDEPVTVEEAHEILFRLITLDIVEPIAR